tara:strand:+ start:554 stop:748 length:195 start_codon:yes stop_codon:yes gene_type:complete
MMKNFIITQIDDTKNIDWCDILIDDNKNVMKFNKETDALNYLLYKVEMTPIEILSNNIFITQLH